MDVTDTNSLEVIHTMRIGQDTQPLLYISQAIPEGEDGKQNLGTQGLGFRVEKRLIAVDTRNDSQSIEPSPIGNLPQALLTVREVDDLDMFQIIGRDLIPNCTYTASALCETCTESQRAPILSFKASSLTNKVPGCGGNEQVLGFLKFFEGFLIESVRVHEGKYPYTSELLDISRQYVIRQMYAP